MKKPLLNRWRRAGRGRLSPFAAIRLGLGLALAAGIAAAQQAPADPSKVLRLAFPVAETNFDPAQISDLYSNTITGHIFESLLTYDYLARPAKLKPLTAAAMPEVSSDFKTYTVRIRPGIYFTPDPAFKGQPRELVAADYAYSIKRIYDPRWKSPLQVGLEQEQIVGLQALRSPRELLTILLTTILIWLTETLKYWFVMQAFPFSVPFTVLMLMTAVVNLFTTIPSTPGYVGTFDAPGIAVLTQFGVPDALSDPQLQLVRQSDGQVLESNTDWGTAPNAAAITAAGLAPSDADEPAILVTLDEGGYTAIAGGENGATGIALIEVFEVDGGSQPKLVNLSTRGYVTNGDRVMIGGIIVNGNDGETKRILLRAMGPSLGAHGIQHPLFDPSMHLYNQAGEQLIDNDDWDYLSDRLQDEITALGMQPGVRREAVLLLDLPPGNYTVIVQPFESVDQPAQPGIGLVEAYEITQ